jgi:hypothetical protein
MVYVTFSGWGKGPPRNSLYRGSMAVIIMSHVRSRNFDGRWYNKAIEHHCKFNYNFYLFG